MPRARRRDAQRGQADGPAVPGPLQHVVGLTGHDARGDVAASAAHKRRRERDRDIAELVRGVRHATSARGQHGGLELSRLRLTHIDAILLKPDISLREAVMQEAFSDERRDRHRGAGIRASLAQQRVLMPVDVAPRGLHDQPHMISGQPLL